jgi:hypothetical protein
MVSVLRVNAVPYPHKNSKIGLQFSWKHVLLYHLNIDFCF